MADTSSNPGFAAFKLLFMRPGPDGVLAVRDDLLHREFLAYLASLLRGAGDAAPEDFWNCLAAFYPGRTLVSVLSECFFEMLAANSALTADAAEERGFLLAQACGLASALGGIAGKSAPARMAPNARAFLRGASEFLPDEAAVLKCDPFAGGRSFAYSEGRFHAANLDAIRDAGAFFGYEGPRRLFREALADFAAGKSNVPLLVSSLPGHGKTQLAIAHTLAHDNLTLILPDADVLEHGLVRFIGHLARRKDRKFVVFFDDIVPDEVDFYAFRTHVGGAYSLPPHIMVILASNYPFPPSILSRGRSILFPTFDEVKCVEMVSDFLATLGMAHPNENLISMIAADYTEDFGQKKFPELSPRTLVRYLERYRRDPVKRRTMLQLSCGEIITKPDGQLFYDFNIELMRKLYGDAYIEALLKEKLRTLGE